MRPYIGITDFTNYSQVEKMRAVMDESAPSRDLMVGTMMICKTMTGLPSKWAAVFPDKKTFEDVYRKKGLAGILNALHYADYEDVTTFTDLARAIMIANHRGPFKPGVLDALQLDMIWPSPDLIEKAIVEADGLMCDSTKEEDNFRDFKVILQVGRKAMDRFDNDPQKIAAKIKTYGGTIHGVLFDRSGGLGKEMDSGILRNYVLETKNHCPEILTAVAGGLGPKTMHLVAPLAQEFPDLSIDAQDKLRRTGNALDPVDWDLAEIYIRESGKIFT